MRPTHFAIACLTPPLLILLLAGCSNEVDYGPTGTISGKLTRNGKPLDPGTQVVFMHREAGYAAFGPTDAEGNYEIMTWNNGNMPIGTYQVMIQPPAGDLNPETATEEQLLAGAGSNEKVPKAEFPFKYRQTSTSGLSFTIKEGENKIDIDLE